MDCSSARSALLVYKIYVHVARESSRIIDRVISRPFRLSLSRFAPIPSRWFLQLASELLSCDLAGRYSRQFRRRAAETTLKE